MKQKVLIVEDNEPIRENTAELLELNNYDVFAACNGLQGLAIAKEQSPDLILCDIQMPEMDGYHLLQHIRNDQALHNIRFIFFTASSEKKEIETGLKMGANDYIIKPFQPDDLLKMLEKHLAFISPLL